jgi:TPR repeat protein
LEIPRNYLEALHCYKQSAEQGNSLAQLSLGVMLMKGKGISKDLPAAVQYFKVSFENNNNDDDNNNNNVAIL